LAGFGAGSDRRLIKIEVSLPHIGHVTALPGKNSSVANSMFARQCSQGHFAIKVWPFRFFRSGSNCPNRQQCQFRLLAFYFEPRDGIFPTVARSVAVHRQNPTSRNCCWARCACRMSRTVFLSVHPCFHGLHRPHADDLRALILRCVSFVFTGCAP
jgi:hypothetical protein